MIGMVNDLLDAAKLETSGIGIEMSSVLCDDAVHEVVQQMTPVASQKNLTLRANAPDSVVCWADPVRLSQVLTNLVANAIKFSKSGVIEVQVVDAGGVPTVEVHDQGVGIDPDQLDSIFDAYDSGSNGSGRRDSSGLGLAISRSLVEAKDGVIPAHSADPGQGSTFRVTLRSPNGQSNASRKAKLAV
ncbi:MAG: HAMP domain-containing histidine kinase [Acidimicrobiia bacterium]|nr:HAMP domain-containing histidine kinase [Acidimicrobiia bacterium]